MTQTLRRELRNRFEGILSRFSDILNTPQIEVIADLCADAALEVSGIRKTDEVTVSYKTIDVESLKAISTPTEYNAELFKGDWREYPEHLQETARVLRDVWNFVLPAKPQKKTKEFSKGAYKMFCFSMEQVKQSCGEFGVEKVLTALHEDWKNGFKGGIAPYTIAQPTSLVNVAAGKAREMRDSVGITQKTDRPNITIG